MPQPQLDLFRVLSTKTGRSVRSRVVIVEVGLFDQRGEKSCDFRETMYILAQ